MFKRPISRKRDWLARAIDLLPVVAPVFLAVFSLVAVAFLVGDSFKDEYIWSVGLIAASLASWLVAKHARFNNTPGSSYEKKLCGLLLIVGVIIWTGFNGLHTSQHVYTNRDPATYAVTGAWLTKHDNLHIAKPNVVSNLAGVNYTSAGFGQSTKDREIFAQGVHLLPALLGLGGRVVGVGAMLHINVIFGAVALMAIYGFARFLVRPRWALVATTILAGSLPLIYFSRDTYTEPLTAAFIFGCLSLIWLAQTTKKYSLWFLAGILAGAGAMVRIDAYLTIAAIVGAAMMFVILADKKDRKRQSIQTGLLLLGTAITAVIGWLDVSRLSSGYYIDQLSHIKPELFLILAIFIAGILGALLAWHTGILKWLDDKTRRWRGTAVVVLVIVFGLALASRPLWYQSYRVPHNPAKLLAAGRDPNPKRTYNESTLNWLAWYIGPIMVIAGFGGLAIVSYRLLKSEKHRALLLLPAVTVVGITSALYLVRPRIAPDQIWASRRLLPIIMPGFLVMGAVGLEQLYGFKSPKLKIRGQTLATIAATAAVISPLVVTYPFIHRRNYVPMLGQVLTTCDNLPKKSVVFWTGLGRLEAVQPTRTFCDAAAYGIKEPNQTSLAQLAKQAYAKGYQPILGVFGRDFIYIKNKNLGQMSLVSSIDYGVIDQPKDLFPRNWHTVNRQVMLGELQPDGSVKPLTRVVNGQTQN